MLRRHRVKSFAVGCPKCSNLAFHALQSKRRTVHMPAELCDDLGAANKASHADLGGPDPYGPSQIRDLRQITAIARGDVDTLTALEGQKMPHVQDTIAIADRLFTAGRTQDALDWVQLPMACPLRA